MSHSTCLRIGLAVVVSLAAHAARAQSVVNEQLLIQNPTPDVDDNFTGAQGIPKGLAVTAGNAALVGVANDDVIAQNSGIAYLFDTTTGALHTTFNNPNPGAFNAFGSSVAGVGASNVVIGSPNDDTYKTDAGAAYLFDTTGPTATLLATIHTQRPAKNARQGDRFGISVASNGSLIAVGATHDLNSDVGSVFLYDQAGAAVSRIDNPAPIANDHFGWSLAMTSTHILVGAPHDDGDPATGINDEGSAYLYNTAGNLLQTFRNPVPRIGSGYGWAVAFLENAPGSGSLAAGTYALVSGNDVDQAGARSGAVYMYDLATGNLVTTMASQAGDALGYDVAGIPGTNLVVSAGINEDSIETNSGAGYLFHAESGNILLKFKKAAPGHFDFFGHTIAPLVDGSGQVLFGVEEDDTGSQDTGAVYKFAIPEPATLLLLGVGGLTLLHRRRAA